MRLSLNLVQAAAIPYRQIPKHLSGHRVLLVGGAGFIGHNLAIELRQLGTETMVLDNLSENSRGDNYYSAKGKR